MRFVGRVSYPLYLLHPLGLAFAASVIARGGVVPETACLALGLALSLAMASGLHRLVEKPLIRVGKRTADCVSPAVALAAPSSRALQGQSWSSPSASSPRLSSMFS